MCLYVLESIKFNTDHSVISIESLSFDVFSPRLNEKEEEGNEILLVPFFRLTYLCLSIENRIETTNHLDFYSVFVIRFRCHKSREIMLISSRLLIHHSRLVISTAKCLFAVHSDVAIVNQMKRLSDEKKYDQALQLFDTYNKKYNSSSLPSRMVTLALKACTETRDLERAKDIHHHLSLTNRSNPYIILSLVDCYSKLNFSLSIDISLVLIHF